MISNIGRRCLLGAVITLSWLGFIYVWGSLGWKSGGGVNLYEEWWFDNTGHAIFGILAAFTLLHIYLNYSIHGHFYFGGRVLLFKNIIGDVALLAGLWELGEFLYDTFIQPHYPHLPRAQFSSKDTTLDITISVISAAAAMAVYYYCGKIYDKRYPDLSQQEEIATMEKMISNLGDRISTHKRGRRKQLRRAFLNATRHKANSKNSPPRD